MPALPDMIGLTVHNMAESLRFYRLLGLDIPHGKDAESYVDVITPNGYRISWNTIEMMQGIDPIHAIPPAGHRMSLAFKCDSPADMDALYKAVTDAGFTGHKPPWDAFWGQRYAVVLDPDGNLIDLFAPLAA